LANGNNMNQQSTLDQFIKVFSVIPKKECEWLIRHSKTLNWAKHHWESYDRVLETNHSNEFDRTKSDFKSTLVLNKYINSTLELYWKEINQDLTHFGINGFETPLFNRYEAGTEMRPHADHIQTIFDGIKKGIPILSVVGLLNDDFGGGEFCFWDDHTVSLKAGDIVIFPSLFMYRHRVTKVTSGTRYSFVSWSF
jgi:predicted 2-oxoglutarate/Fe(II)-dependent dioxygenase YbiX